MVNNKTVLAITLARGNSKRILNKNIVPINGKPLICYTIKEVLKSKYIDRYVISTDDDGIKKTVKLYRVEIIDRPPELASATTKSSDALLHAVKLIDEKIDYVVEIMATNPLKTHIDIDGCVEKLYNTGADSVASVVRIWDHHPSRVKYIKDDRLCDFYPEEIESRRQDLVPPAYVRNGSIYAMTYEFLMRAKSRYDKNTRPYVMPEERSINIDEPVDLYVAEAMMSKR